MHIEWRLYGKPGVSSVPIPAGQISLTGRSAKSAFYESGFCEAAVGDLTQPAIGLNR